MAITEISRDWGRSPSIVRIESDDSLATALGSTYLADEADNIKSVNDGPFEWLDEDLCLIKGSDGFAWSEVTVSGDDVTQAPSNMNLSLAHYTKEADDGSAAAVTAETPVLSSSGGLQVQAVRFLPSAALTANNTNYATLTVVNRDAAGSSVGTIAAITTEITGSGDWVAFVLEDFGTLANATIAAGGTVTFEIEKAASGVVVPAGSLEIEYVAL
jgi:hypothetical protein